MNIYSWINILSGLWHAMYDLTDYFVRHNVRHLSDDNGQLVFWCILHMFCVFLLATNYQKSNYASGLCLPFAKAPTDFSRFGMFHKFVMRTLRARFMEPTWGPYGAEWTPVSPMLSPWTFYLREVFANCLFFWNRTRPDYVLRCHNLRVGTPLTF